MRRYDRQRVRIVQLNLAWDQTLADRDAVLDAYHTLTGWSDALAAAGADVMVVQRFASDGRLTRGNVSYEFVGDHGGTVLPPWAAPQSVVRRVVDADPAVVHVNGLMFPGIVAALRRNLPASTVIVLQDHSGSLPRRLPWPIGAAVRTRWQRAFRAADASVFTARSLATRWHEIGLPRDMPILEIPEASTTLGPIDDAKALAATGVRGSPRVLWVGRVDRNKDPRTILDGFEMALQTLPRGGLTMVIPAGASRDAIEARIEPSAMLRDRVVIVGPVPHREMAAYYSAAEIFVSASHHEGSGYALIEAMACGAVPCVTDIPAFRALTGGCGALWPPGNASACAQALITLVEGELPAAREAVRRRFDSALAWPVLGRALHDAYNDLLHSRRARA